MTKNGFSYLLEGFKLIKKAQLRRFVIIPLLINILVFASLTVLAIHYFSEFNQWAQGLLPTWLSWLSWLMWFVFLIVYLVIASYSFTVIATIIASPFNTFLSAEVIKYHQHHLQEDDIPAWKAIAKEIPKSLKREWQKIAYYIPRALLLFILLFIPVINIVAPILWFLFNAWMLSLQYVDYAAENQQQSFQLTRKGLRENQLLSLSFGGIISLLTVIPIINLILIPAAVAGGTTLWLKETSYGKQTANLSPVEEIEQQNT